MIDPAVVLIVDDDLGFVTWLGVTLAAHRYATLPATSASAAQQLIGELRVTPDLAVVSLELTSMDGLLQELQKRNPAVKVIAIGDIPPPEGPVAVNAAHSRSEQNWLATVERVLDLRSATGAS